jgi:hypothetical protein
MMIFIKHFIEEVRQKKQNKLQINFRKKLNNIASKILNLLIIVLRK